MALHPDFPKSPHALLDPAIRWFPADEALREKSSDKLLPPLVPNLRKKVREWRARHYEGATETSKALLKWWFQTEQLLPKADGTTFRFQYYYAQREAVETIIYLYDVAGVRDKHDLAKAAQADLNLQMIYETWARFVVKMATGSGKTKVMSLVLAWSYFHKLYEPDSDLARNFLLIAPNIIVLDRIRTDFDGLKIFFADPVLPDNGYMGQNWRDDFQMTLHIQDEVRITNRVGNIFLTNIHRVYSGNEVAPSPDDENTMDYFLGTRPVGATNDSKIDLGDIVRDIDELVVINDEAHHVHDDRLAWFKSIEDIHNRLVHKGKRLALQVDVTATPKHNNGAVFPQTVSDYPLVEAIFQNVVKHPVIPDEASMGKLNEPPSSNFTERYRDHLALGVEEWRKAYAEHEKLGKKAVLFVMTDDTKNCDEVAAYLEQTYPELAGAVLTIHTNKSGEISESISGPNKDELEKLRAQSNQIDSWDSPYKAIVSVLMLKEGWDVKNVTTIVGLRKYAAESKILPEQTLGRGLRKMYPGNDIEERVSVIGTEAFMSFVNELKAEGVILERAAMGTGTPPKAPIVVEIDKQDKTKNLETLDIEIPVLSPRIYREYKNLSLLKPESFGHRKVAYKDFSEEESREIVFKDIVTGNITHITRLDTGGINYQGVVGHFTRAIMNDLRLVSGYDILFGYVKDFIRDHLFDRSEVELESLVTLRNLSETEASRTIVETFKKEINALTIQDKGNAEIRDYIKIGNTRPFVVKDQAFIEPKKSLFNRVVGDSHLELRFARFLDDCSDVVAFAKNYFAVNFKLDYVNADGDISNYYPDFIVKTTKGEIYIVETKGLEDLDVPPKMARLKQWCSDMNAAEGSNRFGFVFVDEKSFDELRPVSFDVVLRNFHEYQ